MVDMDDNLLVVMTDWSNLTEYMLTNPKKVCWLLTTMDQLPCIIRVKYYFSVIDISCQKQSISCTTKIILAKALVLYQLDGSDVILEL